MYPHPLRTFGTTHIGMRPTGPRSPLNITHVAFSLYHIPLGDSSGLYSGIVMAWGGLDQITEDEAGKGMFRRVSICCLEMVVALAVEIGEERGRNIKNIDQM